MRMYGSNSCSGSVGAGTQLDRAPEVHGAVHNAFIELDHLESAVSELMARLEPVFNRGDNAKAVEPEPAYGSPLAQQIGVMTGRVAELRRRVRSAIVSLEV
jgi:hypothetical protein